MTTYAPERLSNAVAAICPDIRSRVADTGVPDERRLWWDLSACILSSQVPYALATAAADAIDAEGLLLGHCNEPETLTRSLTDVLGTPLEVEGKLRYYRFPMARARQLSASRAAISAKARSLSALLESFRDAQEARSWLVCNAPGIGPKQASMFLRNAGVSYDLAILDRHVLNYMKALGIYTGASLSIAGLNRYGRIETVLRDHAVRLDCPIGLLDWAIWIVMRVANRKLEHVAI